MDILVGSVSWVDTLQFDESCKLALVTDVCEFIGCTAVLDRTDCTLLDGSGTKRGWVQYDAENCGELSKEHCVVVGKKSKSWEKADDALDVKEYFILVVKLTSVDTEYKRVGVGLIQSGCVVKRRSNVRVV